MMTQQDEGIDIGERCPACDAVVRMALVEDELRWARCQAGHVWKRCSVGIALITQSRTRICSTCGSEFKNAADASCGVEESLLEQRTRTCCICRGGRPILH
ncbi:hypothetical protein FA10DRAFT_177864 [Acaromyces ingoldii]|uniref:Transcription factor IIIC putative zinc-finger domain-containing protein n=1 Tax=Acaromyces ingoldii TaxID=215250 RepID=A0A316YGV8_9BASI|nr:hypothetical protein FA10DRAFT_177864 [Acaromyces ingoldii]PWN87848.1 hypothetical protein FA10DRAFT_177864 [Acaromyces ingoldii]